MAETIQDNLVKDSVLPMVIQTQRFLILESLLTRLNGLSKHSIIMLTDQVPSQALLFFADQFSLIGDGWQFATTEPEKHQLIKEAIEIHRHKGTPWAIKRVLELLGYSDFEVVERPNSHMHNAHIKHNGYKRYGHNSSWTNYSLISPRLLQEEESSRIKAVLQEVAPLRCQLNAISKNLFHNNTFLRNNTYRYDGVIKEW